MKIGRWIGLLAAATLLAGCGDFWQAPSSSSSFSLSSNPTSLTVGLSTTSSASTITVTPASSFTGTVSLTCAITTSLSNATAPTCNLGSSSLTFSSSTQQTTTLTATTGSGTTLGAYTFTVTGVSGSVAATTTVCVEVGTGTCSTTAGTSGKFYILNSSALAGYSISSGSLNLISNSSFTLTGASAIAVDPNNHLWVATSTGITPYTINSSTGALTQGNPISAFNDQVVGALEVDPSGKWLIDASKLGYLYAYPITTSGTQDTSRSIQSNILLASTTVAPGGIAISPSGSTNPIIAVAEGTAGTQIFSFNSGNSSPISVPSNTFTPYGQSGVAQSVAVAFDPSNQFLYIAETNGFPSSTTGDTGALRVFAISASKVAEISYPNTSSSTTPYASGGTNPHAILAYSNGYVYVANYQGTGNGVVTEFLLSASTPSLTLQSNTVPTSAGPYGMTVDSTGDYVLVVNNLGTSPLSVFTFDATTTGKLDTYSLSGSLGASPVAIVAAPK